MSSCSWLLWIRDFIAWSALNLAECISTFKFVEVFFFVLVDGQAFRVVLFSIKSIWSIFRVCFKNCFSKPKHLCGFWSLRERRAQLARPSGPRLAPAGCSLPLGARSRRALAPAGCSQLVLKSVSARLAPCRQASQGAGLTSLPSLYSGCAVRALSPRSAL